MARDPGIYVEILIRAGVDEIWRRTQVPDLHELWDLRFTAIRYLPKQSEDEPQRFLYSTRIGFGLKIDGEGESTGTREDATGIRTSALKFWSADPKSSIEEGAGYWQECPNRWWRSISDLVRLSDALRSGRPADRPAPFSTAYRLGYGIELRSASYLD